MSYLLDTNVLSELIKPRPDPGLTGWLAGVDEDDLFISVVTLAELRYGIERLPDGTRRAGLESWLTEQLVQRFAGRIIGIDAAIADCWGRLVARRRAAGRPIGGMDAFLAATAECQAMTLITRNVADFAPLGLPLLNPWLDR